MFHLPDDDGIDMLAAVKTGTLTAFPPVPTTSSGSDEHEEEEDEDKSSGNLDGLVILLLVNVITVYMRIVCVLGLGRRKPLCFVVAVVFVVSHGQSHTYQYLSEFLSLAAKK